MPGAGKPLRERPPQRGAAGGRASGGAGARAPSRRGAGDEVSRSVCRVAAGGRRVGAPCRDCRARHRGGARRDRGLPRRPRSLPGNVRPPAPRRARLLPPPHRFGRRARSAGRLGLAARGGGAAGGGWVPVQPGPGRRLQGAHCAPPRPSDHHRALQERRRRDGAARHGRACQPGRGQRSPRSPGVRGGGPLRHPAHVVEAPPRLPRGHASHGQPRGLQGRPQDVPRGERHACPHPGGQDRGLRQAPRVLRRAGAPQRPRQRGDARLVRGERRHRPHARALQGGAAPHSDPRGHRAARPVRRSCLQAQAAGERGGHPGSGAHGLLVRPAARPGGHLRAVPVHQAAAQAPPGQGRRAGAAGGVRGPGAGGHTARPRPAGSHRRGPLVLGRARGLPRGNASRRRPRGPGDDRPRAVGPCPARERLRPGPPLGQRRPPCHGNLSRGDAALPGAPGHQPGPAHGPLRLHGHRQPGRHPRQSGRHRPPGRGSPAGVAPRLALSRRGPLRLPRALPAGRRA
mmetsp:Transcript_6565/g.27028  ORF Transcript_6565/g.27028 Transcript_6565/m.27028 type:complete len:515 (-) Transcript_6565:978-2522(-)